MGWNVVILMAWSAIVSWLPNDRLEQAHPLPDAVQNFISRNNVWRMSGGEFVAAWAKSKAAAGPSYC